MSSVYTEGGYSSLLFNCTEQQIGTSLIIIYLAG